MRSSLLDRFFHPGIVCDRQHLHGAAFSRIVLFHCWRLSWPSSPEESPAILTHPQGGRRRKMAAKGKALIEALNKNDKEKGL
jgi:hypothetical protein